MYMGIYANTGFLIGVLFIRESWYLGSIFGVPYFFISPHM